MPLALFALTIGAFAIGTTEFVIVGLVPTIAQQLSISLPSAGLLTGLAHGVFFSIGSTIATSLVAKEKAASAIAIMFGGLTVALVTGVPFGTFIGQHFGWRENLPRGIDSRGDCANQQSASGAE
ncbi:putative drug efflux protein [Klebsiella pneumoniae]|uniref:Putative drug efflux protein n=1 Tax=Klebsiella pneumoniae TaxID=573 RepID=A0A2X3DCK7_KLEPN|nr:putative drug efflux protein [Klebsiella pneumoniae]